MYPLLAHVGESNLRRFEVPTDSASASSSAERFLVVVRVPHVITRAVFMDGGESTWV